MKRNTKGHTENHQNTQIKDNDSKRNSNSVIEGCTHDKENNIDKRNPKPCISDSDKAKTYEDGDHIGLEKEINFFIRLCDQLY